MATRGSSGASEQLPQSTLGNVAALEKAVQSPGHFTWPVSLPNHSIASVDASFEGSVRECGVGHVSMLRLTPLHLKMARAQGGRPRSGVRLAQIFQILADQDYSKASI